MFKENEFDIQIQRERRREFHSTPNKLQAVGNLLQDYMKAAIDASDHQQTRLSKSKEQRTCLQPVILNSYDSTILLYNI